MDYKLLFTPIEAGGTWVLDYDECLHDDMEEVILRCGREDLILCSKSILIYDNPERCSLHLIGDNYDLSDFWAECYNMPKD